MISSFCYSLGNRPSLVLAMILAVDIDTLILSGSLFGLSLIIPLTLRSDTISPAVKVVCNAALAALIMKVFIIMVES